MATSVVGLEIAADAVRAVEVTLGRRPVLTRFGEVALAPGVAHDSEVVDAGAVGDAVRTLWRVGKFSSRRVVLGLSSWRVLVRDFSSPLRDRSRVVESLPFETQEMLPVAAEHAVMDFVPTVIDEDGSRGMLVAANAGAIEDLLAATSSGKVTVSSIDLLAFGLARLSSVVNRPDEVVAMVHVGRATTVMTIVRGGTPLFVRMLPAEIGSTVALAEASADLAARLRSTVDYFTARGDGEPVSRVVLSGAASLEGDVAPALQAALGISPEWIDPAQFIRIRKAIPVPLMQDLLGPIALTIGGER